MIQLQFYENENVGLGRQIAMLHRLVQEGILDFCNFLGAESEFIFEISIKFLRKLNLKMYWK